MREGSAAFNYDAKADLFLCRSSMSRRGPLQYLPFPRASHAVRFVIEELPSARSAGMSMEVNGGRYDIAGVRGLYDSAEYPLARKKA